MACCCAGLGQCSSLISKKLPKTRYEDAVSRLGHDIDDVSICNAHYSFFTVTVDVQCAACGDTKPRLFLRSAIGWMVNPHPRDRICISCLQAGRRRRFVAASIKPINQNPRPKPKIIASLINQDVFMIPVATRWYKMIMAGEKIYKFFSRKIAKKYLNKIVLMRAMTPDGKSRIVCGAVVLGAYDPNAPLDPAHGCVGKWKFGYQILHYVPFSPFRFFFCKAYAGGTPKRIKDVDVLSSARLALSVFCGSVADE